MPQSILMVVSVNNVCRHNAFPPKLGGKLTCGSFQLGTWRLNVENILSFTPLLYNNLVFTLTVDVILQSKSEEKGKKSDFGEKGFGLVRFWFQTFTRRQILNHGFHNASDFESDFLQCVKFWMKNFPTCQILNWYFFNVSDFEFKNFHRVKDFDENNSFKKSHFDSIYHTKLSIFAFFVLFLKNFIEIDIFQCVSFRRKNTSMCQNLNSKFFSLSEVLKKISFKKSHFDSFYSVKFSNFDFIVPL